MEILLLAVLIYLLAGSLVLFRNHFECTALKAGNEAESFDEPLVSVCIPARNEEKVIRGCVESLLVQDYPNLEILVLDDESTDQTATILRSLADPKGKLKIMMGTSKPVDWLGKPWACAQLSEYATGSYLIFTDADVWFEPDAVRHTVRELSSTDALTVWPQQILGSFWEQMIIPMVYYALFTLLPAVYVERSPRWIPSLLHRFTSPMFAAANGQYLAFKSSVYDAIGGHHIVKNKVVEDVELARAVKKHGFRFRMLHGASQVYCRMYQDHHEIWNGFRKNFLPGFGHPMLFIFMWLVHISVYLFPLYTLVQATIDKDALLLLLSVAALTIPVLQRLHLAWKFDWNPVFSAMHTLAVCWFQALAVRVSIDRITRTRVQWKGRSVVAEKKGK